MAASLISYNDIDTIYDSLLISYDGFLIFDGTILDYSNQTSSFTGITSSTISGESNVEVSSLDSFGETSTDSTETSSGSVEIFLI
jgi:hypothetical protein